jgi:hypothetical protein
MNERSASLRQAATAIAREEEKAKQDFLRDDAPSWILRVAP